MEEKDKEEGSYCDKCNHFCKCDSDAIKHWQKEHKEVFRVVE